MNEKTINFAIFLLFLASFLTYLRIIKTDQSGKNILFNVMAASNISKQETYSAFKKTHISFFLSCLILKGTKKAKNRKRRKRPKKKTKTCKSFLFYCFISFH